MNEKVIILGTPHGVNVSGKASPDGRFKEYAYGREIVNRLKRVLEADGHKVCVDIESDIVPAKQRDELQLRCDIVNALCKRYGKENCIYVSVHVNASGVDGNWHKPHGWSVYTSIGQTKADVLADWLWTAAKDVLPEGMNTMRADRSDGDVDFEASLFVLNRTSCPAVLTENFFMDNEEDLAFLESEEGKEAIVSLHRIGIESYLEHDGCK